MNSPLLRQHQENATEQTTEQAPAPTTLSVASAPAAAVPPAVAVGASATSVAPYGFDPAGPTPPLVPVRGADVAAVPVSVVPVSSGVSAAVPVSAPVVEPVVGVSSSGEPVIPAYLRQMWADVEVIQEQVSNRLSLEEEEMSEMSVPEQQAKTQVMIDAVSYTHL